MRESLSKVSLNERAIPLALLFITVLSFGLLIPRLGFYWDDWPVIYMTRTQGVSGFWAFYQYDRPFSAWTYILTAPILGTAPFAWHVFTLLLRWATAVFLWASLRIVWPQRPQQALWIAILFSVSPIFTQQYISVAYSQHWICYLLYFVSIYFMLRAQRDARSSPFFSALAVLFSLLQMLTMEYFLGLELLRPFILWFYFREREPHSSVGPLVKRVIGAVWIYWVVLLGFVIWRMFFLQLAGEDPNRPVFLERLLSSPLGALLDLAQKVIQDFVYLLTSWLVALKPADIDLHRVFSLAVLIVAVFAAIALGILLSRYQPGESGENGSAWHARAMALGVLAILLGTVPVWLIGRQVSVGALGSRFSLAGLFGVSLLFVGFLEWLTPRTRAKITVICLLAGVAVHANLHNAKAFQDSWEKQRTFYWHLFWRAPYIPPGTAFISSGEIFPFVGLYSTSMGISMLYPPVEQPTHVPYWFFSYAERLYRFPKELLSGTTLEEGLRNYSFRGNSRDAILLEFTPELDKCLQLVSPRDIDDRDLTSSIKALIPISNLSRIQREPLAGWTPPGSIFGEEPEHTWCYYFEKADLAHQYGDWQEVIRLMDEAKEQGFAPTEMKEFLPLLNAYLQTGDVESALTLSLDMKKLSDTVDDRICRMWLGATQVDQDAEFTSAYEKVRERLSCFD